MRVFDNIKSLVRPASARSDMEPRPAWHDLLASYWLNDDMGHVVAIGVYAERGTAVVVFEAMILAGHPEFSRRELRFHSFAYIRAFPWDR